MAGPCEDQREGGRFDPLTLVTPQPNETHEILLFLGFR